MARLFALVLLVCVAVLFSVVLYSEYVLEVNPVTAVVPGEILILMMIQSVYIILALARSYIYTNNTALMDVKPFPRAVVL